MRLDDTLLMEWESYNCEPSSFTIIDLFLNTYNEQAALEFYRNNQAYTLLSNDLLFRLIDKASNKGFIRFIDSVAKDIDGESWARRVYSAKKIANTINNYYSTT
jgi:hypothetical protein